VKPPRLFTLVFLAGLLGAYFISGPRGVAGWLLGTAASVFNLVALWHGVRVFARPPSEPAATARQTFLIVLACFVKMPAFIALGFVSWRIGGQAPAWFVGGVALVYSLLVRWATAAR
jgi:hypothetical protein